MIEINFIFFMEASVKASVKSTGEIVEVNKISDFNAHGEYIGFYYQTLKSPFKTFYEGELDFEYEKNYVPNYWEKLKHQYAGMAMLGILNNQKYIEEIINKKECKCFAEDLAVVAVDIAVTLAEKLKTKE